MSGEPSFPAWLSANPELLSKNIVISEAEIEECQHFAVARLSGSADAYKRRNQCNLEKIKEDIFTGAMGELAVYHFLTHLGYNVTRPDFNIYAVRQKSYDADMHLDDLNIHCKSQHWESAKKYGISWILQYGKFGQDKLFKCRTDKDYIAMALLNKDMTVTILGIMSIPYIFDNELIGEPKLKWFQGVKKALYIDDLPEDKRWQLP